MKTSILGLLYLASLTACNKGKMGHKGCTQQTTCETEDPNASLLHSWYNKSELTTAYIGDKLSTKPGPLSSVVNSPDGWVFNNCWVWCCP
ncbi:hypothetical protein Ptr902_09152 [Pyrenophora tritici-repentis]|uniref:Uncharacterized protein n=1 Tax=Pyrenophora tritici-repentis TaxID=45151 RepID=A0A5M9LRM9_9PLEO|nr:hypothetical protein PtrV1_03413 [Pyrenophora tritici-repentis]KAF7442236.1 hypothetical protein A1F99_131050 [Pyrenophora tritici-repentis]KAF7579392.1 hypothetical protein PtrM4_036320 [Pyrenophora tritici-repentis]KAI0572339.1 hypothetical protein Alg215_09845 [Pyrenophora tritici-repentis]KAI0576529.1 hypothetical protein Alg130_08748 [Pyrenophora tritici-repentis]